jgi:hypothetical protein
VRWRARLGPGDLVAMMLSFSGLDLEWDYGIDLRLCHGFLNSSAV